LPPSQNHVVLLIEAKGEARGAVQGRRVKISTKPVLTANQPPLCRGFKSQRKSKEGRERKGLSLKSSESVSLKWCDFG
jgi:hypothetical protein